MVIYSLKFENHKFNSNFIKSLAKSIQIKLVVVIVKNLITQLSNRVSYGHKEHALACKAADKIATLNKYTKQSQFDSYLSDCIRKQKQN